MFLFQIPCVWAKWTIINESKNCLCVYARPLHQGNLGFLLSFLEILFGNKIFQFRWTHHQLFNVTGNLNKIIINWAKNVFSQVTIAQVATSQMWNFTNGKIPKVRLGLLWRQRLQWEGQALWLGWAEGRALRLEQARNRTSSLSQTWEIAAWEIPQSGSCHSGGCQLG